MKDYFIFLTIKYINEKDYYKSLMSRWGL